jgi:hypothetical protein
MIHSPAGLWNLHLHRSDDLEHEHLLFPWLILCKQRAVFAEKFCAGLWLRRVLTIISEKAA